MRTLLRQRTPNHVRTTFFTTFTSIALTAAVCILLSGSSLAQCPAVGHDSTCGTLITVTDSGASVSFTGQGPYDGVDDTFGRRHQQHD